MGLTSLRTNVVQTYVVRTNVVRTKVVASFRIEQNIKSKLKNFRFFVSGVQRRQRRVLDTSNTYVRGEENLHGWRPQVF